MSATCFGDHCTTLWENSNHISKPNLRFSQLLLETLMSLRVSQSSLQDGGQLFTSNYGVTSQKTWISSWIPWSIIRNKEAVFFSGREHGCCLPAGRCSDSHFEQVGHGRPSREDAQVKDEKLNHPTLEFLHFWCLTLKHIFQFWV